MTVFGFDFIGTKWYNLFKIDDKCDDLDFSGANFPFVDGEFTRSFSDKAYISQLIRFARIKFHVNLLIKSWLLNVLHKTISIIL